jgi:hypothetical protein
MVKLIIGLLTMIVYGQTDHRIIASAIATTIRMFVDGSRKMAMGHPTVPRMDTIYFLEHLL